MQTARIRSLSLCALIIIIVGSLAINCFSQNPATPPTVNGWTLVWSDEFDGPNGSSVDRTKWVVETGGNGWGNQELEYYTDRSENASMHDGNLVIKATAEKYTRSPRETTLGTSQNLGKFSQTTAASNPVSKSPTVKVCGPPSGCSVTTSTRSAGRHAARSTSWRTSEKNPP